MSIFIILNPTPPPASTCYVVMNVNVLLSCVRKRKLQMNGMINNVASMLRGAAYKEPWQTIGSTSLTKAVGQAALSTVMCDVTN